MRALGLLAMLASVTAGGATCVDLDTADDCALNPILGCGPWGRVDAGADGGPPPGCVPSTSSTPVAASCGVFVSSESGDDTNGKGTPAAPYKSIGEAIAGNASTVYACAGSTPYSEAITLSTAVTLFGALDCTTLGLQRRRTRRSSRPRAMRCR